MREGNDVALRFMRERNSRAAWAYLEEARRRREQGDREATHRYALLAILSIRLANTYRKMSA